MPIAQNSFDPFETPDGRVRVVASDLSGTEVWALRFSEPCRTVPGRDWHVEYVVAENAQSTLFSCRLSCFSRDLDFSFIPSTPGGLKEIVAGMSVHLGGFTLAPDLQTLGEDVSLAVFEAELNSERRWWNVVVVAESTDERYGIDAAELQRNLLGCANVYLLPRSLEAEFSDLIGIDFSVWAGAARSFRPGFDKARSPMTAHPVIRAPYRGSGWASDRAIHILGKDAFDQTVRRAGYRRDAPGFADVRQIIAQQRVEKINPKSGNGEKISALRESITALKEEVAIAMELGAQANNDLQQVQDELDAERAKALQYKARIAMLEDVAAQQTGNEIADPESFSELAEWIGRRYVGRLSLHPRAARALKDAKYERIEDVAGAIKLLAEDYVDMRAGRSTESDFNASLAAMGLQLSKSISNARIGEQKDTYFVRHKGKKCELEWHLKKGAAHDERYSLRVYFFYDEFDEEVIVGWLPSHLKTRQS
ncbi:cell division protein ZapB [Vannielia sp.]|uniref:cell division protein ZapB n=1 Tax=Vannielia sp. TaxID=2813045 RepID=UPI003BA88CC9